MPSKYEPSAVYTAEQFQNMLQQYLLVMVDDLPGKTYRMPIKKLDSQPVGKVLSINIEKIPDDHCIVLQVMTTEEFQLANAQAEGSS